MAWSVMTLLRCHWISRIGSLTADRILFGADLLPEVEMYRLCYSF